MTVEERLLRLERQLSNVKRIVLLSLLAGLTLVLWPHLTQGRYKTIRAQSFVVEDLEGVERGDFNSTGSLNLKGESGRAILSTGPVGPMLSIQSREAHALLTLFENASLELRDEKGQARAVLGSIQTVTSDGREIKHPVSSLLLFGPDGKAIYQAPFR